MVFKIIHEHTVLRLITINACKNCFHNKHKGKKNIKNKKNSNIELIFSRNTDKSC